MIVDKKRGLSSYFIYRYGFNEEVSISDKYPNHIVDLGFERIKVKTGEDLLSAIKSLVEEATADGKTALALSGGIDSAILAKYMPAGSRAYTFRCIVPGIKVTDETERASYYAKVCGLDHKIIDIYWEDIERVIDDLMRHKGGPVHSIEAQIYLAALEAKERDSTKSFSEKMLISSMAA